MFSKNNHQHVENFDELHPLLRQAGLTLKLPKFHFIYNKIEFLGQILMPGCLVAASKNVEAIKTTTLPTGITRIKSFEGAGNV